MNKMVLIIILLIKKLLIKNSDYYTFTKKIETNPKAPKFNVYGSARITNYKNILTAFAKN